MRRLAAGSRLRVPVHTRPAAARSSPIIQNNLTTGDRADAATSTDQFCHSNRTNHSPRRRGIRRLAPHRGFFWKSGAVQTRDEPAERLAETVEKQWRSDPERSPPSHHSPGVLRRWSTAISARSSGIIATKSRSIPAAMIGLNRYVSRNARCATGASKEKQGSESSARFHNKHAKQAIAARAAARSLNPAEHLPSSSRRCTVRLGRSRRLQEVVGDSADGVNPKASGGHGSEKALTQQIPGRENLAPLAQREPGPGMLSLVDAARDGREQSKPSSFASSMCCPPSPRPCRSTACCGESVAVAIGCGWSARRSIDPRDGWLGRLAGWRRGTSADGAALSSPPICPKRSAIDQLRRSASPSIDLLGGGSLRAAEHYQELPPAHRAGGPRRNGGRGARCDHRRVPP